MMLKSMTNQKKAKMELSQLQQKGPRDAEITGYAMRML